MAATVFAKPNPKAYGEAHQNPKRPPLLPSDVDNGVVGHRRPKSREVTARYLSSSTPSSGSTTPSNSATSSSSSSSLSSSSNTRRSQTPIFSRNAPATPRSNTPLVKRSQSADRRRPVNSGPNTPGNSENMSAAAKLLVSSTRSLSGSFQGESYSLPTSKAKPAPAPSTNNFSSMRKGTPERRRDTPVRNQTENRNPFDQQRWPGRSRDVNSLTKSVDYTADRKKLGGSGNAVRALQKSMIHESNNNLFSGRLNVKFNSQPYNSADQVSSDVESVSSASTGAGQERENAAPVRGGRRGIAVPARFLGGSQVSKNTGMKTNTQTNTNSLKKLYSDSPVASLRGVSGTRGLFSPLHGAIRPASPSKLVTMTPSSTCSSRGMLSPAQARNGVASSDLSSTPSILSFAAEARRGKVGENRIADAQLLRLLHNRHLQWRYVNARADAAMLVQKVNGEKSLYNACVSTSKLRHSVENKRVELELLQKNLKLYSLLKKQMLHLDDWDLADLDHTSSLSGVINALEANTVRLPIIGGARADIQNLKDAISSAVDVMHAMGSSICLLLSKADKVNPLASELANVTAKECALLDECRDLLSQLTAVQVRDCSLRTHLLQQKCALTSPATLV